MSNLPTPLRRQLENTIKQARKIAEAGARHALEALAVHESDPYPHMDEAQRDLRHKLLAQARQLGDSESQAKRGTYEIKHLAEKLAYDQWHRLLFARYLLENDLLISPEHGVSVTLDDCEELNLSLGLKDAWAVAANFAAKELPEIFRGDDPVGAVELSVNDRKPLIELVIGLPIEVFTANDSLGWCYQFWQAEKKEEVNAAGNKIGADELPSVTQLFTEDYMVDFLLDNTLGAWHAGKVLAENTNFAKTAKSEDELRNALALPGCPWKYLRYIKAEDGKWTPAAGTFDGWPKMVQELKCLDPCMGSGHFVVGMFERLVALRIAEENLDETAAVSGVIEGNLFGLEIDPRCTQIGAFNLALAAWRRVGYCRLPSMNLACSGLAPNAKKEDWEKLAGDNDRLQSGMARLYTLFQDAPVLGSLINPRLSADNMFVADYHEIQPLLEKALAQETKDDTAHEMAVTARGLAKAAEILAGQFTLVATNVPYLVRGKQGDVLRNYIDSAYPRCKPDLAAAFLERCWQFAELNGSYATVTPQNWLFLGSYRLLRKLLLTDQHWNHVSRLGSGAAATESWEVLRALSIISNNHLVQGCLMSGMDAPFPTDDEKAAHLFSGDLVVLEQDSQVKNPDCRIVLSMNDNSVPLLSTYARAFQGIATGEYSRFGRCFWEVEYFGKDWVAQQSTFAQVTHFGGREHILHWQMGKGDLAASSQARVQGLEALSKAGVVVSQMRNLPVCFFTGDHFDNNVSAMVVLDSNHLTAVWAFCSSPAYNEEVRKIDQKMSVTNATLTKVPFNLPYWQKVAEAKYPMGLPKPFSSDPTQWLFNGHPKNSDQALHVAVARLLGYQWPRQTGSDFPDCPSLGPDGLETLADEDGIVCLSATKGEAPAAERLRVLLAQALGNFDLNVLLVSAGPKGSKAGTLDDWLRDEFFEQHCALFHHRPFIWHVWDGHKTGFSALMNYHKLDHANLEKLTYAYLGDWIRRQHTAVEAGEAGSDARLQAAKQLQNRLKLILEGEPPFDLFVRWKPLSQQAIGWQPDLNDGVRMNIRPFLAQDIPGGKKGAGILRSKPNIKWEKDRGKEPVRAKSEFPWFWQGSTFTGDRVNDVHLTREQKEKARK